MEALNDIKFNGCLLTLVCEGAYGEALSCSLFNICINPALYQLVPAVVNSTFQPGNVWESVSILHLLLKLH